jgi:hypothetical protein
LPEQALKIKDKKGEAGSSGFAFFCLGTAPIPGLANTHILFHK